MKLGCLERNFRTRLEPYVGKLTSKVLMGLGIGNESRLPDHRSDMAYYTSFLPATTALGV